MKHKIYNNCHFIIFSIIVFIGFTFFVLFGISLYKRIGELICLIGPITLWLLLGCGSLIIANRFCSVVVYNEEKNTLTRKGLFIGFKYVLPISNIAQIIKMNIYRNNEFFVIIDNIQYDYYGNSKHSPIRIPFTQRGKEFIRLFFDGELPSETPNLMF